MSTLDKVREIIRAEVDRANPIEDARGPLELIVESSVRASERDGQLAITVLDESGQPAPDRTMADVIAAFRAQHPSLFRPAPAAAPTPGPAPSPPPSPASEVPPEAGAGALPGTPPAAAPGGRDWLIVGDGPGTQEPGTQEPEAPGPAARPPLAGGLDAARARLAQAAERFRPGLTLGPQAIAARLGRVGQALRASVSAARATLRDFGDRSPAAAAAGTGPAGPVPVPGPRAPRVDAATPRATRQALIAAGVTPWFRRRHVIAASAGVLALVLGGGLLYALLPSWNTPRPPSASVAAAPPPVTTAPARRPSTPAAAESAEGRRAQAAEPANTGSVPASPPPAARAPAPLPEGALRGTPEVIDTATLSVGGKVAPLFGVQWARGAGEPADLAGYLRGREVVCLPAEGNAKAYRCEVDGQDLSKVVLFNGGGRATPDATPDLLAAEAHARSAKTGLWAKASP